MKVVFSYKSQVQKWPPNDLEHHKVKNTPKNIYYYSRVPNFTAFRSAAGHFQDIFAFVFHPPNLNTELEHLTVESTLYTLNTIYPRGPNFGLFRSMTSRFRDTRSSKMGNAPNDPPTPLEHLTVKSTLFALNTYLWGPHFASFRSTSSGFQDIVIIPHWLPC